MAITREDIQVNIQLKDDDLKKGGRNLRWFKMEMLGVMFFGMAMQRTFAGLLQPAAEAFGIMDLWGTMLMVVFLPIMQLLVPLFIDMITGLMSLPDSIKIVVGAFAVLGLVLGTILTVWGQLSLGWGSLMKALSGIGTVIKSVITWFTTLSTFALTIFGVILAIVIGFVMAWKTNFGKIKEWVSVIFEGIKNIILGIFQEIKGLITIIVGIFTLNFDKIGEGWKQMWSGMGQSALGFVQVIAGIVTTIGLSVLRVIVAIINGAIGLLNKIPGVEISKIDTGATSGFEKEVRESTQISIKQENIISTTSSKDEIDRAIKANNSKLVTDIQRLVGA